MITFRLSKGLLFDYFSIIFTGLWAGLKMEIHSFLATFGSQLALPWHDRRSGTLRLDSSIFNISESYTRIALCLSICETGRFDKIRAGGTHQSPQY
jgi:hypothetical protein